MSTSRCLYNIAADARMFVAVAFSNKPFLMNLVKLSAGRSEEDMTELEGGSSGLGEDT